MASGRQRRHRGSAREVQIQVQADGARAEPMQWKSCLILLMAWVRMGLFPLRDASWLTVVVVQVSFLPIATGSHGAGQ